MERILDRNRVPCRMEVHALTIRAGTDGWIVSAKLTAAAGTAWAVWSFDGSRIVHANRFAALVGQSCR